MTDAGPLTAVQFGFLWLLTGLLMGVHVVGAYLSLWGDTGVVYLTALAALLLMTALELINLKRRRTNP